MGNVELLKIGDKVRVTTTASTFHERCGYVGTLDTVLGHPEIVGIVFEGDIVLYHFTVDELKKI